MCARDLGIIGGVQRAWGRGLKAVPIHLGEYHRHPTNELLHQALATPAGWDAFVRAVYSDADSVSANKRVAHWDKRMRVQTQRRDSLPPVYGNGAIEAPMTRVWAVLELRTFRIRVDWTSTKYDADHVHIAADGAARSCR